MVLVPNGSAVYHRPAAAAAEIIRRSALPVLDLTGFPG